MSNKAMSFDQSVEEICDAVERFRNSDMRARNCIPLESRWTDSLYPDIVFARDGFELIDDEDVGIFMGPERKVRRTDFLTNMGSKHCIQSIGPWNQRMRRMYGSPPGDKIAYSIHVPGNTVRCGVVISPRSGKHAFVGTRRAGDEQRSLERGMMIAVNFSCSARLSYRYEWTVAIGYENGIRLLMPTDRSATNELFKLRDIPDGRARRAALCNFVKSHWRRKKAGDKSPVREHIRGAEHFTWNGLSATIMPPAYDISRIYGSDAPKVDPTVTRSEGLR